MREERKNEEEEEVGVKRGESPERGRGKERVGLKCWSRMIRCARAGDEAGVDTGKPMMLRGAVRQRWWAWGAK